MRKFRLLIVAILASMSAVFAQKIAVLDFKAGAGISQSDVDGISAVFTTYFSPRGYTIVERNQVDRVLREQNFQGSSLTEYDMVRLGQILNVNKIVVGDVNIVAGQYNVDVRVVDVQGGYVTGRDGATFPQNSSYRETMRKLAERLASQIAVVTGSTGEYSQPSGKSPSGRVETILGYLQVYPEDLGTFNSMPTGVIRAVNNQGLFGYGDWRLPTNEELSLMMTQKEKLGLGSGDNYMSSNNASSGRNLIVRLVTTGRTIVELNAERQRQQEAEARRRAEAQRIAKQKEMEEIQRYYVDLGLPSGTLWKKTNEDAYYYPNTAERSFGSSLPTKEQWEELFTYCTWNVGQLGFTVTGKNGNSIYFENAPHKSGRFIETCLYYQPKIEYLTSTPSDMYSGHYLAACREYDGNRMKTNYYHVGNEGELKLRVRLVYKP